MAGMPGSETALEEMMCRVLGDFVQEGFVAKLADDLYCGANTIDDLLTKFKLVLEALQKCGLRLSPAKTEVCPRSTTILGWIWTSGELSASPPSHRYICDMRTPNNSDWITLIHWCIQGPWKGASPKCMLYRPIG